MFRTPAPLWLLLAAVLWRSLACRGQEFPAVACPQYFQYLQFGGQFIGKVTLPVVPPGTAEILVEIKFSQRVPVQGSYYGRITLFNDQQSTLRNLRNGIPISYRVDFPLSNILPKVTSISVNGFEICSAIAYPPPNTKIELQNRLQTSTQFIVDPLVSRSDVPNGFPTYPNAPNTFSYPNQDVNFNAPSNDFRQLFATFPSTTQRQQSFSLPQAPQSFSLPQAPQSFSLPQAPQSPQLAPAPAQPSPDLDSVCGVPDTVRPFLYGGAVTARGQYPWLSAIYKKESTGVIFICGGSLISARTVLTAAHCFRLTKLTAPRVVVYLGRHDLGSYSESGVMARDVSTLITHEDYNSEAFPDADLAILHLQASVSFSSYIKPICLWNEDADLSLVQGQTAFVAGWGEDEMGNKVSPLPKVVDTSIVNNEECLRTGGETYIRLTSPRTICAGKRDGTGPCLGDSGGGLMLVRNGRWMLRGVVSAGQTGLRQDAKQFCKLNDYVIYCDIAKHITWVRRNMLM